MAARRIAFASDGRLTVAWESGLLVRQPFGDLAGVASEAIGDAARERRVVCRWIRR